ncbi:acyloxyacyl hydrolase [Paraburkholderia terrae]|uniref:acyloxyacyl hydrolase n=1 Tax=Paraburkholderia terrae TaxID=311230 RepID=UPI0020526591|nr:acyloxyacyl hydrolase [Paraburkholderia terrae]BDC45196.1 lipid A deacylase [Paraburkholderia terrae]
MQVKNLKGLLQHPVVRDFFGLTHRSLIGASLIALSLATPELARADQFGLQVAGGIANSHDVHESKVDIGGVWDPHLSWWDIGGWHFAAVMEGHVAYWHSSTADVHDNVFEFGVTPVFRFIKSSGAIRPFVEAGVGVRLLSHPSISSHYTMSSAFQFADMVGVGASFGVRQQYVAGFRFQHLSNASIKEPNPGIDFEQLYVQYNF